MKILHVTNYDNLGGAGIAAFRLHTALRQAGEDSRMLVRTKGTSDPMVAEVGSWDVGCGMWGEKQHSTFHFPLPTKRLARLAVKARGWLGVKLTKALGLEGGSLNLFPTGLHKVLNASDADVIHLHWINNEMISIKEIAKIKKPIVWTLHDMWPLCGAEHFPGWATGRGAGVLEYWSIGVEESDRVSEPSACGGSAKGRKGDSLPLRWICRRHEKTKVSSSVNRWVFRMKQKAWRNLPVSFVAPSNWMAEKVRQSKLFADNPVTVIPNCLDLDVFQPLDLNDRESAFRILEKKRPERERQQVECRRKWSLPLDKKLILFGAFDPADPRKGGDLLEEALRHINRDDVELVIYGSDKGSEPSGIATHWLGGISSDWKMAEVYNAADVYVCPSRADNLPNTIAEALACGIPCVGFKIGGIPDMIEHRKSGWVAEPYDTGDFASGIIWVFNNSRSSSESARAKAAATFLPEKVTRQYVSVYELAMEGRNVEGFSVRENKLAAGTDG